MSFPSRPPASSSPAAWVASLLLPAFLCGFSQQPSTVFYNGALAVVGWGGVLLFLAGRGVLDWARALGWGLLAAGLASVVLAAVQYLAPAWADGQWIARPVTPGRAFANLRQPNQLSSLLLMAVCCVPALWAGGRPGAWRWAWPVLAALTLGIAFSSSRTGAVGMGMLAVWALVDRGLPRAVRRWFVAGVVLLALWWALLWAWGHLGGTTYFGEARLDSGSDISSSRFRIWSNVLDLIALHPWTGVGWGRFNAAWTLTAFPDRPVAFFDHTHNLVLQLAVELGIPAATGLLVLVAALLWSGRGGLRDADPQRALWSRACLMMLMLLGWHSLLEYPLWYPYFLLPALAAGGIYLALGWARAPLPDPLPRAGAGAGPGKWALGMRLAGIVMIVGALHAIWDYQRIVQIFAPHGLAGRAPLAERIEAGRGSWWFGHHADYALVTMAEHPSDVFDGFRRPLLHLIDARLMVAYAKALAERGERDKAVYVAQRLREFRHPLGEAFLAVCEEAPPSGPDQPFQCDTQPVALGFEDVLPR